MAKESRLKKFLYDNSLSLVLGGLFLAFLVGLFVTGYRQENENLQAHNQPTISMSEYARSGEFGEAVFENWESEFLQMWALVMLTIWLRQKGSTDSKKIRGTEAVDATPRFSVLHAHTWRQRRRAVAHTLYSNSLGLALLVLFVMSFALHAVTGTTAYNEQAIEHGEPALGVLAYLMTSQFWFESFQNWQSEFLAVVSLLLLSVFLRQHGSPESKPIGEPNKATGE